MTCLTGVVIHQLFPSDKIGKNFFIESTSEFQMSVTFLLVNENIKSGYSFSYLDQKEHFGTKSLFFFLNFSFCTSRSSNFSVRRQNHYTSILHVYMTSLVNVCDPLCLLNCK